MCKRDDSRRSGRIGITFKVKSERQDYWQALSSKRALILSTLPVGAIWQDDGIHLRREITDLSDRQTWPEQRRFLQQGLTAMLGVLVPNLKLAAAAVETHG